MKELKNDEVKSVEDKINQISDVELLEEKIEFTSCIINTCSWNVLIC